MNLLRLTWVISISIVICQLYLSPGELLAQDDDKTVEVEQLILQIDSLIKSGNVDSAASLGEYTLEKAGEIYGQNDTTVANVLHRLGKCYYFRADFTGCQSANERALEIRENVLGENHPDVARSLNNLATVYSDQGKYAQADSLHNRALAIREKILEPGHLDIAKSLNNLALLAWRQGRFSEAEPLYERALDIAQNVLGDNHPGLVHSLNNLAILNLEKGEFCDARDLCLRAITILEKAFGFEHPHIASSMTSLANVYQAQGKYSEAESLYVKAQAVWTNTLGPDHPNVAVSLDNLAALYTKQERFAEAESHHKEALAIREKTLGLDHPDVALSLDNLAILYAKQSRYSDADPMQKRALNIREKVYGPDHPLVAASLYNLADLLYDRGNYTTAESLYVRALSIREDVLGPYHPYVAGCLRGLAQLYGSRGQIEKSAVYYEKLRRCRQHFIEHVFAYASEDQKMRYIEEYPLVDHSLFSAALMADSDDLRRTALEMLLKAKGAVIDAISAEKQIAYCSYQGDIQDKAQKHAQVCGEISTLSLAGVKRMEPQTYSERLQVLYQTKDSLEAELSKSCADFQDRLASKKFAVEDIAGVIPPEAVLWEYVRYEPYDFNKIGGEKDRIGRPRYLAFTLDHSGSVTIEDLGDAEEIDSLIGLVRNQIEHARTEFFSPRAAESARQLQVTTAEIHKAIFEPLATSLESGGDIFISPDGQLNLLPFEILPESSGKYVIENYAVSYLSSGKDLLRFEEKQEPSAWALAFADPDFDLAVPTTPIQTKTTTEGRDVILTDFSPVRGVSQCMQNRFDPLPNSRKEVQSISQYLEERAGLNVDSHYDDRAVEGVLKELDIPPRILHLATHGYFCGDIDLLENEMLENPLLRSGLALAGANRLLDINDKDELSGEDGVLTAFEVSGLNLVGTELVTLSACESGVGQVKNGEGVYGLRRAFQHAGARTIVMSLWKVPDRETCELMDAFYGNWLSGLNKREALRQAELTLLASSRTRYESPHPFLWGGFVLVGAPD